MHGLKKIRVGDNLTAKSIMILLVLEIRKGAPTKVLLP